NGDVTPCPYLPVFGGNLLRASLREIWDSSDLFVRIRERSALRDRCGACEFQRTCGGCRARAYGVTGDFLAEDSLCTPQRGTPPGAALLHIRQGEHGQPSTALLEWDDAAREKMTQIPAFVRGMVTRAVESHCRRSGISRVTPGVLEEIRSRMPTP